jgi:hypothetical protein
MRFQREYVSSIQFADVRLYPALQRWYKVVTEADDYQVGISKAPVANEAPANPAPVAKGADQ